MSEADRVDGGVDSGRRHFLVVATTVTGVAGAAMTAIPFLASWKPSARAQALGEGKHRGGRGQDGGPLTARVRGREQEDAGHGHGGS